MHQDEPAQGGWLVSGNPAAQTYVDLSRGQPHVRTLPCAGGASMQGWEAVPVAAPAARVGAADGAAFQLRINATAPVYGYPAGAALCLSLDLCQSHGPGTSWGG